MSDSPLLARHLAGPTEADDGISGGECGGDLESGFSYLRGAKDRGVMLELRKKDGNILALGYGWLERAEFNPSEGITLSFAGQRVRIRGRNLNAEVRPSVRLFEGIARHRVVIVREATRAEALSAPDAACIIDAIEW